MLSAKTSRVSDPAKGKKPFSQSKQITTAWSTLGGGALTPEGAKANTGPPQWRCCRVNQGTHTSNPEILEEIKVQGDDRFQGPRETYWQGKLGFPSDMRLLCGSLWCLPTLRLKVSP